MDTVVEHQGAGSRDILLAAARALDTGDHETATETLRTVPVVRSDQNVRVVALALWRKVLLSSTRTTGVWDPTSVTAALEAIGSAVTSDAYIWNAYSAIPALEKAIGSEDAAALIAATLWDRTLEAHEGFFVAVFELFFRAGNVVRCHDAWRQFIAHRSDYVPGYWHFLLYAKTLPVSGPAAVATSVEKTLTTVGRGDLLPLIGVYLRQMRQVKPEEILKAAIALAEPSHRGRVASYMTGLGFMPDDLPAAVAAFHELGGDDPAHGAAAAFMEARLANAEGRWSEVLDLAAETAQFAQFAHQANLLRANALGHLRRFGEARKLLEPIAVAEDAASYLKSREAFVRLNVELLEKGLTLPADRDLPDMRPGAGRPLAQSLWVGRRLRWIERLAIKSYLDNGWRFQLYTYDDVENVPEGCEVLDASIIIPRREVFREGFRSGLHAGSVGAFSDLFRYRLLYERGGMWTDTDVINRRRFEPDGMRFVSTEISDAGLTTLNGAIMAAPAGHPFVRRAYERAAEIIRSGDMFFTRIGPHLLAELIIEEGVDTIDLMPPRFLSGVFWMNTASLLEPYEVVSRRAAIRDAVNLHVYTEMWRLLGLGLDEPPGPDTFLGRLYTEHLVAEVAAPRLAAT